MPPLIEIIAIACLIWYIFIVLVCAIGVVQIFRNYSHSPPPAVCTSLPDSSIPHITVIRPCKGIEPYLYECLASTCQQDYPLNKLSISLCVATRNDAALDTLTRIKHDYPHLNIKIYIEEEDELAQRLGPNPKIRNMSRAYREASSDLVWILDCNIWTSRGVCARMVDRICGYTRTKPNSPTSTINETASVTNPDLHIVKTKGYRFVHHLPVAIDQPASEAFKQYTNHNHLSTDCYGGRLDETFLSSAHAKMYIAINTVAVAPCICGKSSMFRRSHLNSLTSDINLTTSTTTQLCQDQRNGIDFFSDNICEDHLIGDLLWKKTPPGPSYRNHGLVYSDVALQPVSGMSVASYIARRVRWLRVRKFTVPLATLVEPGTESLLCSAIGSFGITMVSRIEVFESMWLAMAVVWTLGVVLWIATDRAVYVLLQANRTVERHDAENVVPPFARKTIGRGFGVWLMAWVGREGLALPIWIWAIWGGASVVWRDKKLWVGFDMKVHEYDERVPLLGEDASEGSKVRRD